MLGFLLTLVGTVIVISVAMKACLLWVHIRVEKDVIRINNLNAIRNKRYEECLSEKDIVSFWTYLWKVWEFDVERYRTLKLREKLVESYFIRFDDIVKAQVKERLYREYLLGKKNVYTDDISVN